MKFSVIADSMGNVLGASMVGTVKLPDGKEMEFGIIPQEGQIIHEVDLSEELMKRHPTEIHLEIHKMIRLKMSGLPQSNNKQ